MPDTSAGPENEARQKNNNAHPKEIHVDDDLREEEGPEIQHLKTKPVPAVITLTAGLVAAVYTYLQHRPLKESLFIIFITLVVFLVVSDIIKFLLDRIEIVVEKEPGDGESAAEDQEAQGEDIGSFEDEDEEE